MLCALLIFIVFAVFSQSNCPYGKQNAISTNNNNKNTQKQNTSEKTTLIQSLEARLQVAHLQNFHTRNSSTRYTVSSTNVSHRTPFVFFGENDFQWITILHSFKLD